MSLIQNFGRNVIFEPKSYYEPRDEAEVLALLAKHAGETIRVVGSKHGWSDGIVSKDVVLSLCHFDEMKLIQDGDQTEVVVGGGCQIKHLLEFLNKNGLTLPSVGLISEQTIAGATANATHGSGRHSLSHYITAARIACFDEEANPMVKEFSEGEALRAARCSLGMLGVVCELRLPCVPQYHVAEQARLCTTVEEALESEPDRPLQQLCHKTT